MKYFDLHVFFSRKEGYSVQLAIDVDEDVELQDEDVINLAVLHGQLDSEDAENVDLVDEIDKAEYLAIKD